MKVIAVTMLLLLVDPFFRLLLLLLFHGFVVQSSVLQIATTYVVMCYERVSTYIFSRLRRATRLDSGSGVPRPTDVLADRSVRCCCCFRWGSCSNQF
jgi:hypothetical protein